MTEEELRALIGRSEDQRTKFKAAEADAGSISMHQTAAPARPPFRLLRERIDAALTAEMIATARDAIVPAERDEEAVVAAQMARPPRYDILPVDRDAASFWVHPRAMPESDATTPTRHELTARDLIASTTPILEVLRLMAERQRGFYFVLRGAELGGLITYSDLNKRSMRTAVFALVNELEEMLIERLEEQDLSDGFIRSALRKPGAKDPDGDWKRISRAWKQARHADVELSKIRYASLAEIVRVAEETPTVREMLAAQLGPDWAARLGELRTRARNKVAHPGHLLVASAREVATLWASCAFAEQALEKLA
jgi:hypothetical protein